MKIYSLVFLLILLSCQQKKKEEKEKFFPVLSFIKSQIAHVDTSLYSITKIKYRDSTHSDTEYVKREQFRGLAQDFLELPDLTENKYSDRFVEERLFDESMNRVIISYKPKNPEKEEIQKLEVLITPDIARGDQVDNFIIERMVNNRDGYLHKYLLWRVDKSFQVTTTTQNPSAPELITTLKVSWNETDNE